MSKYTEALAAAASYCSMSEHCVSEVVEKIKRYELNTEEQSKLLLRLHEDGYLNENRFVNAFVKDKFRFSKWGHIKIRYALRQKGIKASLIEEGLTEISDEDYRETLTELLRQKKRMTKANSPYELRGKLLRFAAGRGFELELAGSCLRDMGLEDNEY